MNDTFTGEAHIGTSCSSTKIGWLWGKLTVDDKRIAVNGRYHDKANIVELRWSRWPWPCMVVVSKADGEYLFTAFVLFKGRRLRELIEKKGYKITGETNWWSTSSWRIDIEKYGLHYSLD